MGNHTTTREEILETVKRQVDLLFEPDDIVEIRAIISAVHLATFPDKDDKKYRPVSQWFKASELIDGLDNWIGQNCKPNTTIPVYCNFPWSLYWGINPRTDFNLRGDKNVKIGRNLWVDFDLKDTPGLTVNDIKAKIKDNHLPIPSLLGNSGHGYHVYWKLSQPIEDLSLWTEYQKKLIQVLNTDDKIHNPERVMRILGFHNNKQLLENNSSGPLAQIIYLDNTIKSNISDFHFDQISLVDEPKTKMVKAKKDNKIKLFNTKTKETKEIDKPTDSGQVSIICPFHPDTSPSCNLNMDKKVFHCFGSNCGASGIIQTDIQWDIPKPLNELIPMDFPNSLLNLRGLEPFTDMVKELSKSAQTPIDISFMMGLSCMAFCTSKNYFIQFKKDWVEPTNLYTVSVLDSANRKSKAQGFMTKPLIELQNEIRPKNLAYNLSLDEKKLALEEGIKRTQKLIIDKPHDKRQNLDRVDELEQELSKLGEKKPTQIIFGDCTPEGLAEVLADNEEKIFHTDSEGGIFTMMSGQYNDKTNIAVYLKGWDGGPETINRKGKKTIFLKEPLLTIGLSVQPGTISDLTRNKRFRNSGLVARFLYIQPDTLLGWRKLTDIDVPSHVLSAYHDLIYRLYGQGKDPIADFGGIITLSNDAKKRFTDWHDDVLEPQFRDDRELSDLKDWGGKLGGTVLRIAGILHCIRYSKDNPQNHTIDLDVMETVIEFSKYLIHYAKMVIVGDHGQAVMTKIVNKLKNGQLSTISPRDFRGSNLPTWEIKVALDELENMGYLARVMEYSNGRKLERYEVNPYLLA